MRLDGVPDDAIKAINPVFCVILGPWLQRFLHSGLRKAGIKFGPIARMSWAFITMSGSMAFAAGVQKLIYSRGPCYDEPLACGASDGGRRGNDISAWMQILIFFLLGLAEILGFATLAEYSYSEASTNLRTLVQSLVHVSSGIGSGMAVSPLSKDPKVLYLYTGLAATMMVVESVFWVTFDSTTETANETSRQEQHLC
jgi:POT family proton-dependent oligopeptide transporter